MKATLCTGLKAVASAVVPDCYWIDDKDFASKRLFLFMFLCTLFEPETNKARRS